MPRPHVGELPPPHPATLRQLPDSQRVLANNLAAVPPRSYPTRLPGRPNSLEDQHLPAGAVQREPLPGDLEPLYRSQRA